MLYYKADIGVIGGSGLYELYRTLKKLMWIHPTAKPPMPSAW